MMSENDAAARRDTGTAALWVLIAGKLGRRARGEIGAALVLALVFLVVAALTLTALVTFAGTGLLVTAPLVAQRSLQYGANGATEIAIQQVRGRPTFYPTLTNCLDTPPVPTASVQPSEWQSTALYRVFCQGAPVFTQQTNAQVSGLKITTPHLFTVRHTSFVGYGVIGTGIPTTPVTTIVAETVTNNTVTLSKSAGAPKTETVGLLSPFQRLVTFYTCKATTATCIPSTVLTHYLVKAVVGFGDRTASGNDTCHTSVKTTCGESLIVRQWTVARANF